MLDSPWKRYAAIAGFILAVLLFGYLLFSVLFSPTATPPTTTTTPGNTNTLPTSGPGGPGTIGSPTDLPVSGDTTTGATTTPTTSVVVAQPTLDAVSDGNGLSYYKKTDGKFYRTTADGQTETLTDDTFFNVESVTWSPDRNRAVLEYPDGANIIYNFQTKTQATLPKHWESFSFSESGDQLAFKSIGIDAENRWLGVADGQGNSPVAVQALGENGDRVIVDWSPNQQVVGTYREATGADRQEIYFIGLNGENFKSMTAPGIGFRSQWTPDGSRLLYSVSSATSSYKPLLWIADAAGESIGANRHSLGLNTWADKCTFASNTRLICAVPQTLPEGAGLAAGVANTIPDDIVELNLQTGQSSLLLRPQVPLSISKVVVGNDARTIYLQDGSGYIYKTSL